MKNNTLIRFNEALHGCAPSYLCQPPSLPAVYCQNESQNDSPRSTRGVINNVGRVLLMTTTGKVVQIDIRVLLQIRRRLFVFHFYHSPTNPGSRSAVNTSATSCMLTTRSSSSTLQPMPFQV